MVGDGLAERVVGIVDEHRAGRRCQGFGYSLLDVVDFACTIQLVAEQVQQNDEIGLQLGHDLGQPQLIALEHAPIGGAGVQQRARHAGVEIGSGAVACDCFPIRFEHICEQVRDRRLSVRPDNHDGPF